MSSGGQAIGGVVGAIAGFIGSGFNPMGAVYGAQIGMTVGSLIDPPKGPNVKGPRLDDLSVQTSTYGAVIPRVYGTVALSGNVFWLENNRLLEVPKETESGGGKGGGSSTTTTSYAYYATFAVGLCEGPIFGVRRIWVGSKLIYDAGSSDQGTVRASNRASELFTLHTGEETQLPDDRMEATLGVGNTPAYRGLAYLVLKDYPLADHGNSLMAAPVKVEIVQSGTGLDHAVQSGGIGGPVGVDWVDVAWNGRMFCAVRSGVGNVDIATSFDGLAWTNRELPVTTASGVPSIASDGKCFVIAPGAAQYILRSETGVFWSVIEVATPALTNWLIVSGGNSFMRFPKETYRFAFVSDDGIEWRETGTFSPYGGYPSDSVAGNDNIFIAVRSTVGYCNVYSKSTNEWTAHPVPNAGGYQKIFWAPDLGQFYAYNQAGPAAVSADGITWEARTVPTNGTLCYGDCLYMTQNSANWYYTLDGINWVLIPIATAIYPYAATYNGAVTVVVGESAENKVITPYQVIINRPSLGSIVESEALNSRLLDSSDIDRSALTQPVRGYTISSVAAIRAALDPLQAAWPFDVIQSGYRIKFVPRGGASVATIPASDLDARGAGDSPGVSITNVREMDSILPRRVSLSYADVDREYNVGEQYAERLNTDAVNIRSTELAIVMSSGEAAVAAEVLLYLAWLDRHDLTFSLPPTYSRLEPSDVITVNASEATYELRLTAITYEQDGRLSCSAKYNAAATYVSTAVGEYGTAVGNGISEAGLTAFALLDLPDLRNTTGSTGWVVAMAGYLPKWPGGALYRSDDEGTTWGAMATAVSPGATMGYSGEPLGAGRFGMIDSASLLVVWLISGELASTLPMSMFSGRNNFAYGAPGRWEIVGALNCVLQPDGTYWLTDLLRGRKGTEWAAALHQAQDMVILLDGQVGFESIDPSLIGIPRSYRAVTLGDSLASGSIRNLTYSGVALECYSPVHLNGNRDPASNDWTLMWVSRTRTFGEWRDAVDAPSAELSQDFQIEIYATAAYATLKRTIKVINTNQATYTSAQQIADFGSNQATLYVMVYQLSPTVGPGQPLITSITR